MRPPPATSLTLETSPRNAYAHAAANTDSMVRMTFDSLALVPLCPRCCRRSAIAPGPMALYARSDQTRGDAFHPGHSDVVSADPAASAHHHHPPEEEEEEEDAAAVPPAPAAPSSAERASRANHAPYMTARSAVFANCKSSSLYDPASLDVRKMYADHDNAPRSIMASPRLSDIAAAPAPAPAADVPPEVDIRNRPKRAMPHPPQTDDAIRSPAMADIRGVNTTLVCVRKDARAAGLERRPAVMSPCVGHIHVRSGTREITQLGGGEREKKTQ